jgi:uncharacterized membrane-anchored protein
MNTRLKAALLALLSVAQLTAAGWSIARYESVLTSGALYKIRIEPVDPADAFRGRYVEIRPSIRIPLPVSDETRNLLFRIQNREQGYVVLANDADGFARIAQVLVAPPVQGDYLKVAHAWEQWAPNEGPPRAIGYTVRFSFDRYYMNEAVAPAAAQRFLEATLRNSSSRAWITVRVKAGVGVIEGLFIDGVPIEQVVAASPQ